MSGQLPKEDKQDGTAFFHQGRLGDNFTVEQGQAAAKACGLNMIAQVDLVIGDCDRLIFFVGQRGMRRRPV